ncbi:hypothetical protein LH991_01100 [Schleiferilactobacillus harbinensis]|nr:hypothetical protein [Schleiferilactobacillus harbinensis]QFR62684.1 hypothetical protein LH991_01100 [Schleiferilactobacillus harbinensis]
MGYSIYTQRIVELLLWPSDIEILKELYERAPKKERGLLAAQDSEQWREKIIESLIRQGSHKRAGNLGYTLDQIAKGRLDTAFNSYSSTGIINLDSFANELKKQSPEAGFILLNLTKKYDSKQLSESFAKNQVLWDKLQSNWPKINWERKENAVPAKSAHDSIDLHNITVELDKSRKANSKLKAKMNAQLENNRIVLNKLHDKYSEETSAITKEHNIEISKAKAKITDMYDHELQSNRDTYVKQTNELRSIILQQSKELDFLRSDNKCLITALEQMVSLVRPEGPISLIVSATHSTSILKNQIYIGNSTQPSQIAQLAKILQVRQITLIQETTSPQLRYQIQKNLKDAAFEPIVITISGDTLLKGETENETAY